VCNDFQQRVLRRGAAYAPFFEDNYVSDVTRLVLCRGSQKRLNRICFCPTRTTRGAGRTPRNEAIHVAGKKLGRADWFEVDPGAATNGSRKIGNHKQPKRASFWHEDSKRPCIIRTRNRAPDSGDGSTGHVLHRTATHASRPSSMALGRNSPNAYSKVVRDREIRGQMLWIAARHGTWPLKTTRFVRDDEYAVRRTTLIQAIAITWFHIFAWEARPVDWLPLASAHGTGASVACSRGWKIDSSVRSQAIWILRVFILQVIALEFRPADRRAIESACGVDVARQRGYDMAPCHGVCGQSVGVVASRCVTASETWIELAIVVLLTMFEFARDALADAAPWPVASP